MLQLAKGNMNSTISKITLGLGILTFALSACSDSPSDREAKVEQAQENLDEANLNYEVARTDSINEYREFKRDAEVRLQENDEKIAALRNKRNSDKKEAKEEYDKKVAKLEESNQIIKEKLSNYKEDAQDDWSTFKRNVNKEMDDLGKAISEEAEENMSKNK